MTACRAPRRATTAPLGFAVFRFALRRGLTRQLLHHRRAAGVYAVLTVALWACAFYAFWGKPFALVACLLLPLAIIGVGGVLGVALSVVTSEAWYYSPAPGKQSMVMLWPRWSILRPDRRFAGNWVAEPQGEGVGGPLGCGGS